MARADRIMTAEKTSRCIADRLKLRMAALNISASELARRASLKPSFLYDIMNGKSTNPSVVKLARIAEELQVGLSYFLGQGQEPQASGWRPAVVLTEPEMVPPLPEGGDGEAESFLNSARLPAEGGRDAGVHYLTLGGGGRKYGPFLFDTGWLAGLTASSPVQLFMHCLADDAMAPTLHAGDMVLVDSETGGLQGSGVYLIEDMGRLQVRRLEPMSEGEHVRISADNARYAARIAPVGQLQLAGRVVWAGIRL